MEKKKKDQTSFSLKECGKNRLIHEMIRPIRNLQKKLKKSDSEYSSPNQFCVLLVDTSSLAILSSFCNVYDILDEGVTVIEHVGKKRQAMPQLEAIYFISPTVESINSLCEDFADESNPHYQAAHVFFTISINDPLIMTTVASHPLLLKHIKTFVEFNLGFVAYEQRVFHFGMTKSLVRLFPSNKNEALKCVDELMSIFLTLRDKPMIRFHSNNLALNESIAVLLQKKLSGCTIPNLTEGRSTLIIVDRTIDIPPLFIHEYTYQAYVYDMLDVPLYSKNMKNNENAKVPTRPPDTVEYVPITSTNKKENTLALLSENDNVYARYRHQHLMVALKEIPQEIRIFLNENAAASIRNKSDMTNEELHAAIRGLPEYQEMLSKFNAHHSITQRCMKEFRSKNLTKIGTVEQDIASGVNSKGKPISFKKCNANLMELLTDQSILVHERVRVLLLYMCMIDHISQEEKRKLIQQAELSLDYSLCIDNFFKRLTPNSESSSASKEPCHHYSYDNERLDYYIQCAKDTQIELSRFQPYVKNIMQKVVQDKLHRGVFQLVMENPSVPCALEDDTSYTSSDTRYLHAKTKNWNFGDIEESNDTPRDKVLTTSSFSPTECPRTIVIFVLGGVTFSETRAAYEVSRQFGVNVIIGGSCLLTPKEVLCELKTQEFSNV